MMRDNNQKNDQQRKSRALSSAALRGALAAYLIYLGWRIIRGALSGDSPMPVWAGALIGGAFILIALGFGVYLVRSYRREVREAEPPQEEAPADERDELPQ